MFVLTLFDFPLMSIQCDNVCEFGNYELHSLDATHDTHIRFLAPTLPTEW
jgi:hypothetical protein